MRFSGLGRQNLAILPWVMPVGACSRVRLTEDPVPAMQDLEIGWQQMALAEIRLHARIAEKMGLQLSPPKLVVLTAVRFGAGPLTKSGNYRQAEDGAKGLSEGTRRGASYGIVRGPGSRLDNTPVAKLVEISRSFPGGRAEWIQSESAKRFRYTHKH